ncbi:MULTISPECIES: TROVE domain-containing protein [Acinetobacter]|uniref:TROVE domain-containing protein n=1 Tax=Acinetobacter TaxID=469 RepID=UPI00051B72E8|nr:MULTISPECIES: TROVE domain-containing protein [Acinetobacter]MCH7378294.1 TROVE domain-containing protein [Acinetobacter higginsii]MCJ0827269.1 TROVE domain-containing protein [Acinetobacter sp. NIPH1876]
MVNQTIFASQATKKQLISNEAGGRAFQLNHRQALAQLAATGTLNHTFYQTAQMQLDQVLVLTQDIDAEFIAKTAVYTRQNNHMKDMPVLLLAILSQRDQSLFKAVFPLVIDNGKQLRNFVQIMRSGVIQRKSLGSLPKKMINQWLINANENQLLAANIGNQPSLADVLKMTHPKPKDATQEAFFAYVLGKKYELEQLPAKVQALEKFRQGLSHDVPDLPMQLLTNLQLSAQQWAEIAKNGGWQMLRMNLNTFARHGVFQIEGMDEIIANKLQDQDMIRKSRVLPYQLMTTWSALDDAVPQVVRQSLEQVMQAALQNVPRLTGRVVVAIDVSGSMASPVTGYRKGATSTLRCVDVASLFACALKQVNPDIQIMPFDTQLHSLNIAENESDQASLFGRLKQVFTGGKTGSIFEVAKQFAALGGGGTDCSIPLNRLNRDQTPVDLMIYFSDNESWADQLRTRHKTGMLYEWDILKQRCPEAKLVCVDLQPYTHTQVPERTDVMNIGGFSDHVFTLIDLFSQGKMHADHWINEIEQSKLPT